ncbi:MAG: hypothetical protein A2330_09310 [Ignavibacteria bacterium RIFOXYB2_FULL_36_7]|nr:MAG: hypothetical protein A2330_09310 [Ignavibacteria bacterium RIFOXYB2_FULL_36_7]
MINNYNNQKKQAEQRLNLKTLDNIFIKSVEDGANCSNFEAQAILSLVKKIYQLDEARTEHNLKPGQMKVIGVSSHDPCGKPLSKCKMQECIVTIYNGKDDDYIRATQGIEGIRRAIILRVTSQAYEQGVLLTHEDLAHHILHCGRRTLNRDTAYFKERNIYVPTRGQKCDIGPGVSHKVKAVELLLQRKNEYEIARLLYHTIESIERYTQTFARVVFLHRQGLDPIEIAFTIHISHRLAAQYLELYNKYNNKRFSDILEEIINKHSCFESDKGKTVKKNFLTIYQLPRRKH